jgi:3-methyladenine DNA glycosylase AlkD
MEEHTQALEQAQAIVTELETLGTPENRAGMARFGIQTETAFGVGMATLRTFAKARKKNHRLALALWQTGFHETRILAALVDNPTEVTEAQMDAWAAQFNSWDLCDQCCSKLFVKTPFAFSKAIEWSHREEVYVKRAGFVLMAALAVHAKKAEHDRFRPFFPLIEQQAKDERNFVKKAVNWALRQIGKRNQPLHAEAITVAQRIQQQPYPSARWIARDALRELADPKTIARIK